MPSTKVSQTIFQIKITLKETKPPIWRRIQVKSNTRMDDFHLILQEVMGWHNGHLHQFIVGKRPFQQFIGMQDEDAFGETFDVTDETRVKLSDIVTAEKFKFTYEYDFGDGWEHELLVEKILLVDPKVRYPLCLSGKLHCPPEDVGGVWGYYDFLNAIKDETHLEHEDQLEWVGGDFDPAHFDVDEVNQRLSTVR